MISVWGSVFTVGESDMLAFKKYILFIFLFAAPGIICAQSSSQATMQVTAHVIYAGSVEVQNRQSSHLASLKSFNLGLLRVKKESSQQAMINVSKQIFLTGPDGYAVKLKVARGGKMQQENSLRFLRKSDQRLSEGPYAGEISTTVEYL